MCDRDHSAEDQERYEASGLITRKQFGVLLAAGIAMLLPGVANAVTVTESDVTVKTPDGTADCYFVHPSAGTAPGVLVWPDIFGLRPALRQMGKRLAESGYSVLVVNPFYRFVTFRSNAMYHIKSRRTEPSNYWDEIFSKRSVAPNSPPRSQNPFSGNWESAKSHFPKSRLRRTWQSLQREADGPLIFFGAFRSDGSF